MEALRAPATILTSCSSSSSSSSSSPLSLSIFPWRFPHSSRFIRLHIKSTERDGDSDLHSDSNNSRIVPVSTPEAFSKRKTMAASSTGWTTVSGMEGPSVPTGEEDVCDSPKASSIPWWLFTKSSRRRMLIAFTCSICGQRTARAINRHAYNNGTVFVQCCGCNAFHKLVDHLNLFHGTNCIVNKSFIYWEASWKVGSGKNELKDDGDISPA